MTKKSRRNPPMDNETLSAPIHETLKKIISLSEFRGASGVVMFMMCQDRIPGLPRES